MKRLLVVIMFLGLFSFATNAFAYNGPPIIQSLPYIINGHTYTEVIGTCQANGTCTVTYFENLSPEALVYFYGLYGTLWVTQNSGNYNYLSRYCNPGDSASCSDNPGTDDYMTFAGAYPWDNNHIQTTRDIWNVPHTSIYFSANLQPAVQLTVALDPQAGGTVTSDPASNFSCSNGTCTGYFSGDVDLTATPSADWAFAYWDNGTTCITTNPLTVTMDSTKTLTAKFFRTLRNAAGNFYQTSGTGGWCTDYVNNETGINFSGHAYQWWQEAIDNGYATGSEPAVSAIVVLNNSSLEYGHVGIVTDFDETYVWIQDSNWSDPYDFQIRNHWVYRSRSDISGYIYCTPQN